MDGIAILSEQIGAVEMYLAGVDAAVVASVNDDPDLMEADRWLGVALELGPVEAAGLERDLAALARESLRRAMSMDLQDGSLPACRGRLPEMQARLEKLRDELRGLMPQPGAAPDLERTGPSAVEVAALAAEGVANLGASVKIAIRADRANDAHLQKAAALLEDAVASTHHVLRTQEVLEEAQRALRLGMSKDFGDRTKEQLLALIVRMFRKTAGYRDRLRELLGDLQVLEGVR
jgi:hypothetical protein